MLTVQMTFELLQVLKCQLSWQMIGDTIINSCRYKRVSPKFLQISQLCVVFFVISLYSYLAVHWIPQAKLNDALHNAGTNNKIHSHFRKLWNSGETLGNSVVVNV